MALIKDSRVKLSECFKERFKSYKFKVLETKRIVLLIQEIFSKVNKHF
jgi:hypothetical protein